MHPVDFPEQNVKYVAPGCGDLPAFNDGAQIISCWDLTEQERQNIFESGKIWLIVLGKFHPPISMRTDIPFGDRSQWPDEIPN